MTENKLIFSKPYEFEGETYTEIDLSGLDNLTAKDLINIDSAYVGQGGNPALTSLTLQYAIFVANIVTKKPLEFFDNLPAKDATALKNEVVHFFYK